MHNTMVYLAVAASYGGGAYARCRALCLLLMPACAGCLQDKNPDNRAAAEAKFKDVSEAYEVCQQQLHKQRVLDLSWHKSVPAGWRQAHQTCQLLGRPLCLPGCQCQFVQRWFGEGTLCSAGLQRWVAGVQALTAMRQAARCICPSLAMSIPCCSRPRL